MKILFINSCVRKDSRTLRIAEALLEKITLSDDSMEEIRLDAAGLLPLNEERLARRTELLITRNLSDPENSEFPEFKYARQFADADTIVMAAPYWDGSFPSLLKTYIENIYVTGIVSKYCADGSVQGLCKAAKLYYVVTAGGPYNGRYSYEYIEDLAKNYFGIPETFLIKAEMLDVEGFDAEQIVADVIANL